MRKRFFYRQGINDHTIPQILAAAGLVLLLGMVAYQSAMGQVAHLHF
jgi:hypothetical protein